MSRPSSSERRRVASVVVFAVMLACGGPEGLESAADGAGAAREVVAQRAAATATVTASDACVASGAHAAHAFDAGCTLCHACGGAYQFSPLTFPRGTTTAGGQIVLGPDRGSASCAVACHGPTPISWSAQGPLACTACHAAVLPTGETRSAHTAEVTDPLLARAGCQGCHDSADHLSGNVRITTGPGEVVEVTPANPEAVVPACTSCHDGQGQPIAGQTPPLLVGWNTTASGDWHGRRAGTGFGGTLLPGLSRGQPELACTMCHSAHASANDFLFARTVNGFVIPGGVIDRAGVGAQFLCESCHEGPRHAQCAGCHGADPMPAGSPCFACHGHEGIVTFPQPWASGNVIHLDSRWACDHCHGHWMPVLEYSPPVITVSPAVTDVRGDRVTITWTTDELATSQVEFGESGSLGRVAAVAGYRNVHAVTLTGLASASPYAFRVRTSDAMRNVRLSAVQSFSTADPYGPPAPAIVPMPDVVDCWTTTATATFRWSAVSAPDGSPVEYRVFVDDAIAFDSPVLDSGWRTETTWSVQVPLGYPVFWWWRVQARNAVRGALSPWSAVDGFWVGDVQYTGGCDW